MTWYEIQYGDGLTRRMYKDDMLRLFCIKQGEEIVLRQDVRGLIDKNEIKIDQI